MWGELSDNGYLILDAARKISMDRKWGSTRISWGTAGDLQICVPGWILGGLRLLVKLATIDRLRVGERRCVGLAAWRLVTPVRACTSVQTPVIRNDPPRHL
jgi:hypothetical protein